jgi:hypothetical protein
VCGSAPNCVSGVGTQRLANGREFY